MKVELRRQLKRGIAGVDPVRAGRIGALHGGLLQLELDVDQWYWAAMVSLPLTSCGASAERDRAALNRQTGIDPGRRIGGQELRIDPDAARRADGRPAAASVTGGRLRSVKIKRVRTLNSRTGFGLPWM